jgi:hypothetical protein
VEVCRLDALEAVADRPKIALYLAPEAGEGPTTIEQHQDRPMTTARPQKQPSPVALAY